MKLQTTDKRYLIYGMLFALSNRIQTVGDQHYTNITLKQQFLLVALRLFDTPPTLSEMADAIGCSYQNVKRMAEHLQKVGYLEIVKDTSDRRKLLLIATKELAIFEHDNVDLNEEFMKSLFSGITEEDCICTLRTLTIMNKNMGGNIDE